MPFHPPTQKRPSMFDEGGRCCRWLIAAFASLTLGACAGLPAAAPPAPSTAIPASTSTSLGAVAARASAQAAAPAGQSGFRPMPQANVALDARLTLIRQAQSSLDVQYYLLGNDEVGHLLLNALRDASARGVRVRLLLDDFYTNGMDTMLLGLAAHPNVEVRLFNPFGAGRVSTGGRWLSLATDFRRLNHRMHNKLFLADGAMAIVGGRNLADGYFMRDVGANFVDLDALAIGPVVPQLSAIFDNYWNSPHVHPLQAVAATSATPESLRAGFDLEMAAFAHVWPPAAPEKDFYGDPSLAADLEAALPHLIWADATAYADSPDKVVKGVKGGDLSGTVGLRNLEMFRESRSELMLFSPYFVPGPKGMQGLKQARDHNIAVRVITNSMWATDEPLASLAYERYRVPMLKMGVELYELSSVQIHRDATMRAYFNSSRAQLHLKLAIIDRKTVILGSMNLDQRSVTTNTELAVSIRSPELSQRLLAWLNSVKPTDVKGSYRVTLAPNGNSLQWTALRGAEGSELIDGEPEVDRWLRLKLFFMSLFVSEDLL